MQGHTRTYKETQEMQGHTRNARTYKDMQEMQGYTRTYKDRKEMQGHTRNARAYKDIQEMQGPRMAIRLCAARGTSTPPSNNVNGLAKDKPRTRNSGGGGKQRMDHPETGARAVVHRRPSLTAGHPTTPPPNPPLGTPPQRGTGEQRSSPSNPVHPART